MIICLVPVYLVVKKLAKYFAISFIFFFFTSYVRMHYVWKITFCVWNDLLLIYESFWSHINQKIDTQ